MLNIWFQPSLPHREHNRQAAEEFRKSRHPVHGLVIARENFDNGASLAQARTPIISTA
jgi:hypothetical protein